MSVSYEQKAEVALHELGLNIVKERLDQAAQQASAQHWSYTHFLGYLLESELTLPESTLLLGWAFSVDQVN